MSSTILWINTVVSLIGVGLGAFLAVGSAGQSRLIYSEDTQ
jgi:hypothetical protein